MEVNENSITIVGCGPGSADYLMPVAHKAIAHAQVLVGAQRLAMGRGGARLSGRAIADHRPAGDQRGLVAHTSRVGERNRHRFAVMAVHSRHVPARGLEAP